MSGWSINPGIWLGKRVCCDIPWTTNVYQLFSFFFIFHFMLFSVKLQLSDILWTHVDMWSFGYTWSCLNTLWEILDYIFSFSGYLSKYKQSMRSIHSIQELWRAFAFTSYNSRKKNFMVFITYMVFVQED